MQYVDRGLGMGRSGKAKDAVRDTSGLDPFLPRSPRYLNGMLSIS